MSYRVWLRSKPGFFTQYDGYVDVNVATRPADEDAATEIKAAAVRKLRASSFPDRDGSMWTVDRIEVLG